ncbi:hypothetical protein BRAS3843_940004 [Bradyrhizobium sp. STM 3843]|nr:hypothetical protein BRAS3843_940004 [Bradyrhizobium sp. STM 3843]
MRFEPCEKQTTAKDALNTKARQQAKEGKQESFHTLCTAGADASEIELAWKIDRTEMELHGSLRCGR